MKLRHYNEFELNAYVCVYISFNLFAVPQNLAQTNQLAILRQSENATSITGKYTFIIY